MSDNLDRRLVEILWKFHNDRLKDPSIAELKPYIDELRAEVDNARIQSIDDMLDWLDSIVKASRHAVDAIDSLESVRHYLNTQESEES